MTDKVHKGQLQTVEGSACGEFFSDAKMDYGPCGSLIYLGECKVGIADHESRHFIQRFIYDASYNLQRVLIAQNQSTLGCTSVTVAILSDRMALVTLLNGDASELSKGDAFQLKTGLNDFRGQVFRMVSPTIFHVEVDVGTAGITPETATILETDMIVRFESETSKDFTRRKWINRTRYLYA